MEVYEVKTRTARQALYTAVGQLVVHCGPGNAARTLVLPHGEDLPADIRTAIGRADIRLLRYRINKNDTVTIVE